MAGHHEQVVEHHGRRPKPVSEEEAQHRLGRVAEGLAVGA